MVRPCAPGLPLFQYKLMANLWLKVLPLPRREALAWAGDHGEGESRDSDCLCLSCLNGKTFHKWLRLQVLSKVCYFVVFTQK